LTATCTRLLLRLALLALLLVPPVAAESAATERAPLLAAESAAAERAPLLAAESTTTERAPLLDGVPSAAAAAEAGALQIQVYPPARPAAGRPVPVLVALHGMGGDGPGFAGPLLDQAQRNGWLVVAPTFGYGDWRDPEQVRRDEAAFLPRLKQRLDDLPAQTGLRVEPRALLYGFSRGCQLGHRFAEFYPRAVSGVASLSCGTYTLPYTRAQPETAGLPLAFPFGLADVEQYTGRPFDLDGLRQVRFLIGVGGQDNLAADCPRQWDAYLGSNRVERAWSYQRALETVGVQARVVVFPETSHAETDEMRRRALDFLASAAG
jgi:pimeloyl-ACP methyl ester carboxylesterase